MAMSSGRIIKPSSVLTTLLQFLNCFWWLQSIICSVIYCLYFSNLTIYGYKPFFCTISFISLKIHQNLCHNKISWILEYWIGLLRDRRQFHTPLDTSFWQKKRDIVLRDIDRKNVYCWDKNLVSNPFYLRRARIHQQLMSWNLIISFNNKIPKSSSFISFLDPRKKPFLSA